MGRRGLIALAALVAAGCGGGATGAGTTIDRPRPPVDALPERVVWDFEHAVRDSQDAFLGLFDFTAVGEMEILLHRYDALGRLPGITEERIAEYLAEDGTPYTPERERKNVGGFYDWLIRPAIGDGGCAAVTPTWEYNRKLAGPYEPLPEGHEAYEPLRLKVNGYLEDGRGGVIGIRCPGGARGLALVYTKRDTERGYDLITIYDDGF